MDKKELIDKVCYELYSHIVVLEWGEGYDSNESHRQGLERANKIREYIKELRKL